MNRRALVALAVLSACDADPTPKPTAPYADAAEDGLGWAVVDDLGTSASALVSDGSTTWALVDGAVLTTADDGVSWTSLPTDGLPGREILWLGVGGGTLLAEVDGTGLMRWTDTGWQLPSTPPTNSLLGTLNPRARPVPYGAGGSTTAWLATAGGLFASTDAGDAWTPVAISSDAGFNLLFTDVEVEGSSVMATAMLPSGLLPDEFSDFLSGVLFASTDGGTTWTDAAPNAPFQYATGAVTDSDGIPWVAALDGGLHRFLGNTWVGVGGPSDALAVSSFGEGVSIISATRGVWRRTDRGWQGAGNAPMVGLTDTLALSADGSLYRLADHTPAAGTPPGDADVHIALSFHVNLYHSYRGDSNTADGYGIDLDVMRNTLDWLDRHPQVRADWDFETYFSLGEWMQTDGNDVLQRLRARVENGTDEVRPMSWNNGAMTNHTHDEFSAAITRAMADLDSTFGSHVPGVQPQECMFTADHIGWYNEVGIDWATLFYSGTPFTALRTDHDLPKTAWYNPFSLTDPSTGEALTTVPVYHHADMVNHGGLAGWAHQIHESHEADQLLVIHFDADAESWQSFEAELAAVEELDFVQFTLLSDYIADHPPEVAVPLVGDVADGTGDGFQSWAEKDFNHTLATTIHQSRELAARAEALAPSANDDTRAAIDSLLSESFDARLLALSTTHFGLAAPVLHPDRVASATAFAEASRDAAQAALDLATAASSPGAGELWVTNPHEAAGTVVVEATLSVSASTWATFGADGVWVRAEDASLPIEVTPVDTDGDPAELRVRFALDVDAHSTEVLRWGADSSEAPTVGAATATTLFDALPIDIPFTECAGIHEPATDPVASPPTVDARAVVTTDQRTWDLSFCTQPGPSALSWTAERFEGLPGTIWTVQATLPDATGGTGTADAPWNLDAESVALSPLACTGDATHLEWRTFGGTQRSRPVRPDQPTWNGQAIDAWLAMVCEDGTRLDVSHDAMTRTSLAMAPMRTTGDHDILAPLGTLWGDPVRHDVRATGGHGAGDVITAVVGSQFRPAAPDWSGQSVRYRLLVGTDGTLDPGTLTLFAHPPLVQVGPMPVPAPEEDDTGTTP